MIRLLFVEPEDDGWAKWKARAHAAVARMLADNGEDPVIDADLYKAQRDRFLAATNNKCAYCELSLLPGQRQGDVEHYRPKGRTRDGDGKIVRITTQDGEMDHPGYYWLAYDHQNLLPSCSACNRRATDHGSATMTGKGEIFPTRDDFWAQTPQDVAREQPLLLNPWIDDPAEHLVFNVKTGIVAGCSERGRATVHLIGLNRDGLPEARKGVCQSVKDLFRSYVQDLVAERVRDEDTERLADIRSGRAEYAAIAQAAMKDCWRLVDGGR